LDSTLYVLELYGPVFDVLIDMFRIFVFTNTEDMTKEDIKLFENYLQSKYELIGDSIDEVLDAVNALKFHYGKDYVIVENESGHVSGDKIGVYITFDDSIKLRSGGNDPKSNIVREMNYILSEEMKNAKLYKVDTY